MEHGQDVGERADQVGDLLADDDVARGVTELVNRSRDVLLFSTGLRRVIVSAGEGGNDKVTTVLSSVPADGAPPTPVQRAA
jgi:hypothetical protein